MQIDLTGRRALVTGGGTRHRPRHRDRPVRRRRRRRRPLRLQRRGRPSVVKEGEAAGRRGVAVQADLTQPTQAARLRGRGDRASSAASTSSSTTPATWWAAARSTEMTDEFWHQVVDVNLTTTFLTTGPRSPRSRPSTAGRIVNMASLAAQNGGGPGRWPTRQPRPGVLGFTKGLAKELAGDGVTVNAVAPGFIGQTPFHDTFTSGEARQNIVAGVPLQREGTPEDVAGAVLLPRQRPGLLHDGRDPRRQRWCAHAVTTSSPAPSRRPLRCLAAGPAGGTSTSVPATGPSSSPSRAPRLDDSHLCPHGCVLRGGALRRSLAGDRAPAVRPRACGIVAHQYAETGPRSAPQAARRSADRLAARSTPRPSRAAGPTRRPAGCCAASCSTRR